MSSITTVWPCGGLSTRRMLVAAASLLLATCALAQVQERTSPSIGKVADKGAIGGPGAMGTSACEAAVAATKENVFPLPAFVQGPGSRLMVTNARSLSLRPRNVGDTAEVALLPQDRSGHSLPDEGAVLRPIEEPPASRSALVSDRQAHMAVSSLDWQGWRLTLISGTSRAQAPALMAVVAKTLRAFAAEEQVIWFPQPDGLLNLTALESLYAHVFGLEATKAFRFAVASGQEATLGASGEASDQATLLRSIAMARQCAAAVLPPGAGLTIVPWRSVLIDANEGVAGMVDEGSVGARLQTADGPVPQAELMFWRLPHSGCSARTSSTGVVSCRLEDVEGHAKHPGFESAPVVVTFPGSITADGVLLPTTRVLRR